MELKDLVGNNMLDAVDFCDEEIKSWDDAYECCQVCRFRLNGIVYSVIEDPDDGYRSSMKEIVIDKAAKMTNIFPPCNVVGRHKTTGSWGDESDILQLIDIETGGVVLEVGTENVDDYYPSFVANFSPENMAVNAS